jgi:hypothetical protein
MRIQLKCYVLLCDLIGSDHESQRGHELDEHNSGRQASGSVRLTRTRSAHQAKIMTDLLVRLKRALPRIREWIDDLHGQHSDQATPAGSLGLPRLASCFPDNLLRSARAVTVRHIPFPPVSAYGLPEFESMASMEMAGITFRNMYFVHQSYSVESVHFHELVHVVQWNTLGADEFLLTYALDVARYGYIGSPLEAMAYELQSRFENGSALPAIVDDVARHALATRNSAAQVFRSFGLTMSA